MFIIYITYITNNTYRPMCVIFYMNINGQLILAKNRDLPYNPHIDIVHEIINGTEVVYMRDKNNGWIEGINEDGTCMVNSSLLENFQYYPENNIEKNKIYSTLVKKHGNKQELFYEILNESDNKYVLEGHTLIAHDNHMYHLENSSLNKHVLHFLSPKDKYRVFSNHGIHLPNEGVTNGIKGVSSFLRRELTKMEVSDFLKNKHKKTIKYNDNKLYHALSCLLNKSYANLENKFHPYRKKYNVTSTTGQLLLNATKKEFVYLADNKCIKNVKYINKLHPQYQAKIRVIIKETKKNMKPIKKINKTYLQKIHERFNYVDKSITNKNRSNNHIKNKNRTMKKTRKNNS